jgi:hypothetical protein
MARYPIGGLLQAIPLLIVISVVIFLLANAMRDRLASFGSPLPCFLSLLQFSS